MKENYNLKDLFKQVLIDIVFVGIGIVIGISIVNVDEPEHQQTDVKPIEEKIDSLNQVIETLEAIKNGRIEEIKNLNDSATLSLFIELIGK